MIQISSTTPAAQPGFVNGSWQLATNGQVSIQVPFGATVKLSVPAVAGVLTLDASIANSFFVPVTADITSMSIINPTDGQEITVLFSQDASGWAVTPAANLLGPFSISTGAGLQSCYKWSYNAADTNWYQIGANGM